MNIIKADTPVDVPWPIWGEGAQIDMPRNHCRNQDRLPFIDPPYRPWTRMEDRIVTDVIEGKLCREDYRFTEIGAVMGLGPCSRP